MAPARCGHAASAVCAAGELSFGIVITRVRRVCGWCRFGTVPAADELFLKLGCMVVVHAGGAGSCGGERSGRVRDGRCAWRDLDLYALRMTEMNQVVIIAVIASHEDASLPIAAYSSVAARCRCLRPIAVLSSAAKNAARSTALRM